MSKRKAAPPQISIGDAVLGFHQSWPYPATVERIFEAVKMQPETGERKIANYYLVRWKGFSGKKALGILKSGDVVLADDTNVKKRQALEAARREAEKAGAEGRAKFEKIFSEICGFANERVSVPPDVWDKDEWKFLWDIFRLPEKLRLHLLAEEERVMREERKETEGVPNVSEVLKRFVEQGSLVEEATEGKRKKSKVVSNEPGNSSADLNRDSREAFAKLISNLFDRHALKRLLYNFEVPEILMKRKSKLSDVLTADHLLRLLAVFPEIIAAWARSASLGQPGPATSDKFAQILEFSFRFADLAEFISRNFRAFLTNDEEPETGAYYLSWEETKEPVVKLSSVAESLVKIGKRKKPNAFVRRIS